MVRYFGQTPDYWLDNGTYQDWRNIWSRELREQPPAEAFLASYFKYDAPAESAEPLDDEEIVFDVSDCEV